MTKLMVSFFDQFPSYNGHDIEIREKDGYVSVKDIGAAINKHFNDWTKTRFAQKVLNELSLVHSLPIDGSRVNSQGETPLIDSVQGRSEGIMVHPTVAIAYAMSDAQFFARVAVWLVKMRQTGTDTPHVLEWTRNEFERANRFK